MNIKSSYHFFVLLAAALLFTLRTNAQANDTTATESVTVTDTVKRVEVSSAHAEEEVYYPDTLKSEFRPVNDDSVMAISNDKGFYYKRYLDSLLRAAKKKVQKQDSTPGKPVTIDNGFLSVIIWIAAVGLFAYLVFRLFLSNSFIFSRNRKNVSADIDIATVTAEDDPDTVLRNAIKSGNYRLAVRYLYLQTLQRLSEKRFIVINSNKTNYEYVNEVRTQKFANEFASLTLQYEYVWYGEYPLDDRLFSQVQEGFNQFNKNIGR